MSDRKIERKIEKKNVITKNKKDRRKKLIKK